MFDVRERHHLQVLTLVGAAALGCAGSPGTSAAPQKLPSAGRSPSNGNSDAGTAAHAGSGGAAAQGGTHAAGTNGSAGKSAANGGQGGVGGNGGAGGAKAGAAGSAVAGKSGAGGTAAGSGGTDELDPFSFFVTSMLTLQKLSGSADGFGGDLRFGKADGLSGADEICRQIAESSMAGSGAKTWHAFLSVTKGPDGKPVNAIDRVGEGPWYDRLGRLVAMNKASLAQTRPAGDAAIANDLPNEDGVPNHAPDGSEQVDNHDILTGSGTTGQLYQSDWSVTCHDWTSAVGTDGRPRVGHSWPRGGGGRGTGPGGNNGDSMNNWMSSLDEAGCAPGVSIIEMGPPDPDNPTVGSGGGYGGFYCFALEP